MDRDKIETYERKKTIVMDIVKRNRGEAKEPLAALLDEYKISKDMYYEWRKLIGIPASAINKTEVQVFDASVKKSTPTKLKKQKEEKIVIIVTNKSDLKNTLEAIYE